MKQQLLEARMAQIEALAREGITNGYPSLALALILKVATK